MPYPGVAFITLGKVIYQRDRLLMSMILLSIAS